MGLQSALTTSLTGLQAAETTIDVVGNNIANSNTVGFKESNTIFATQFLQTISIGSAPSTNSGGTNPRQIGLGVKVAQISPDFTQGTIEISSNPLDVAIQGDGFLIVQNGTDRLYTRNGQLQLNSENEVVTSTGQRVLGFGVNDDFEVQTSGLVPLTIELGAERVAQATSNASFTGVLNPEVDLGATPSVSESSILGDNTIQQPVSTTGTFNAADLSEALTPDATNTFTTSANTTGPGAGSFQYRFALVDSAGNEAEASPAITIDNSGGAAGDDITLTGVPIPIAGFSNVQVYRTTAGGSTFFPVGGPVANTGTFTDTVADGSLGTTPLDDTLLDAGSYSYYVTFYNTSTGLESRPASQVGPETVSVGGGRVRIDLNDIDAPSGVDGFDSYRIYRNLSTDNSQFYRIDEIPVTDDSYVDSTPDSSVSTVASNLVNLDGPAAEDDTLLTDLIVREGETFIPIFQEGLLEFTAEKDGSTLETQTLDITSTTTVLELATFVQESLGIDSTSDVTDTAFPTANGVPQVDLVDGQLIITSNLGVENAINVPLTAFRLTPTGANAPETVQIAFTETQQADGPGTTTELTVFDSLGLPLSVRITTVLESRTSNSTTYRWYASSGDNQPLSGVSTVVGDGLLEFDSNGDLVAATQDRISVQRNSTASESPLEVQLDFSLITSLGETDAQGNPISSLNFASQDGFPPGVLTDFIITDDGLIQGQFSNGTQRTVGQLVMARFANAAGLAQVGDSLFNVGVNSGEPILGTPGEEGIGTLTAGAVELSNTDIGQNLIELILASTQYRGGSRVITTAQELLDELLALRR